MVATAVASLPPAVADAQLHVEDVDDGYRFHLTGSMEGSRWLLQHSSDGKNWQDLLFLDGDGEGGVPPAIDVPLAILAHPDTPRCLFRAVQSSEDSQLLRRLLTERAKWRLSGIDGYRYELRQNSGPILWRGKITVFGGEVAAFETIEQWPLDFPLPDIPTIEGLFVRVADAIASLAEVIDVEWDPAFGFPRVCFIDVSKLIADEERGWTVEAFAP